MTTPISRRVRLGSAVLAAVLTAAVAVARPGLAAPRQNPNAAPDQAPRRSLLLFPVDATPTGIPNKEEMSAILTDVAASRLDASGVYSVALFSRAQPTVARLRMDQMLTDSDVTGPFSEDSRKPIKISKEASFDVAFVGSVDSYDYSDADKQVTMVVSGRLIEAQTGKVLKSVIQNVTSPKVAAGKEDEIALNTARAAGEQLMTKMVPAPAQPTGPTTTPTKPTAERKSRTRARNDWLWGVLAVGLGLGIGLSSSGHGGGGTSGGGGGNDNPPPPPR